MKIAAVTKFKHGLFRALLGRHNLTLEEFGRKAGIGGKHPSIALSPILCLHKRPSAQMVDKMQRFVASLDEYLDPAEWWPEGFSGLKRKLEVVQYREVPLDHLLADPDEPTVREEDMLLLEEGIQALDPRHREVLEGRLRGETLEEISQVVGRTREQVRQREINSMVRLRRYIETNRGRSDIPAELSNQQEMAGSRPSASTWLSCARCSGSFKANSKQIRNARAQPPVPVYCSSECYEAARLSAQTLKQAARAAAQADFLQKERIARNNRLNRFKVQCSDCQQFFRGTRRQRTRRRRHQTVRCPACRAKHLGLQVQVQYRMLSSA